MFAAAIATVAAASPARVAPTLKITSRAPLTVVGSGFASRERVTITVTRATRRVAARGVVAGAGGAFRVRFSPLLVTDICRGSLTVVARGAAGSRTSATRTCRPPDPRAP
jgi:hypothetical protein